MEKQLHKFDAFNLYWIQFWKKKKNKKTMDDISLHKPLNNSNVDP